MVHFFLQIILSSCLTRVAKPISKERKLMLPSQLSSDIVKRFHNSSKEVFPFEFLDLRLNTHAD